MGVLLNDLGRALAGEALPVPVGPSYGVLAAAWRAQLAAPESRAAAAATWPGSITPATTVETRPPLREIFSSSANAVALTSTASTSHPKAARRSTDHPAAPRHDHRFAIPGGQGPLPPNEMIYRPPATGSVVPVT
jgi:hypothetical protein